MKCSFDNHYFDEEFKLQQGKAGIFGDNINPRISKVLDSERKERESIGSLFNKAEIEKYEIHQKPLESKYETRDIYIEDADDLLDMLCSSQSTNDKKQDISKKVKKAKKKAKKRKKNQKKKKKELNKTLGIFYEKSEIVDGALIAELIKNAELICIHNKTLRIYSDEYGFFLPCDKDDFFVHINSILDEDVRLKIKSSGYAETYKQIMMLKELQREEEFFENAPYVNCLNGVVDILNGELLPHSPKFYFKHCINANYIPGSKCPKYLKYINHLFCGDKELIELLRVVQGYICSHYNNAKIAILFIGESHTGKSVFGKINEKIIGKELVSHVDLAFLYKQEYAASLANKMLNVAPDLKNVPLKDVGFFKSLVSHDDTISTRSLYHNPGDIRGEVKMLLSSNHLIEFDSGVEENDVEAVFNRLLYLPVQCKRIDETIENKHMSEELFEERDAIFTWAIEGLKKYIENGERFPKSKLSEEKKRENMSKYCPEKIFFDKYIKEAEGQYESVTDIKEAYARYCREIRASKRYGITEYIERRVGIEKIKKRIDNNGYSKKDGTPIHVYPNIRLKNKYR